MMETTVNSSMCRCCASQGLFKDFNTTYLWMGEEEVYAEMLRFCFDLTLTTEEGEDNGGICEVCITQLRNAANFKKQVQQTEEQFKRRLREQKTFKHNPVKVESLDEGGDSDNNLSEDYQMEADFEVPIKEESPEPKPKKRAAKATTSKAKKAKTDSGETSSKRKHPEGCVNPKWNTKEISLAPRGSNSEAIDWYKINRLERCNELKKHYANIREVLQWSNATLIRCHSGIGFMCCFCTIQYPNPGDLKRHALEEHRGENIKKASFAMKIDLNGFCVKVDITNLQCNICGKSIDTLEQLKSHLIIDHCKTLYTDIKDHMLPFKFDGVTLQCFICLNEFNKFKILIEHMNTHYRNYICDECDAGFVTVRKLFMHARIHKTGSFACDYCSKVFNTVENKRSHVKRVHTHSNVMNKCPFCSMFFKDYNKKERHMKEEHGAPSTCLNCYACGKTFYSQKAYRIHVKRDHLLERRHKCKECDRTFYCSAVLKDHMLKHTKLKQFQCDYCQKAFGRKSTLKEHMRIHENDRRFKCEYCGQAFVQKGSLRAHLRTKHKEDS